MARNATFRPTNTSQPVASNLFRAIFLAILALIIFVGLAVFITWLVINPKRLFYTIEDGSITNFNLANDHLNATYNFLIKAHNSNKRISVYYDKVEIALSYGSQTIAFNKLKPFYQRRHNVTKLEAKVVSRDIALPSTMSRVLRLEKANTGGIKLYVHFKTKTRFKVGVFKLRRPNIKLLCPPVTLHFSSSKSFERVNCDLDYYSSV